MTSANSRGLVLRPLGGLVEVPYVSRPRMATESGFQLPTLASMLDVEGLLAGMAGLRVRRTLRKGTSQAARRSALQTPDELEFLF